MDNHCCKVCGRSFSSGRSLGGHMRCHVLQSSSEKPMCRYELRENPRKSWRLEEGENDMLHANYREGFVYETSGDDIGEEEDEGNMELREQEGEDGMLSQTDSEVTEFVFPTSERRRRSPDSSPEYENEQKVGAFCLLMLSRGVWSVVIKEEGQKSSLGLNDPKNVQSLTNLRSESELSYKPKKLKSIPFVSEKKRLHSIVSKLGKRSSYDCITCHKSFHSYQALGGHRARHKKIKGGFFSCFRAAGELNVQHFESKSIENSYDCSICGKIFASGQALGGHKRSHLVAANNTVFSDAEITIKQSSVLSSSDFNLPTLNDFTCDNFDGSIEYLI